MLVEFFDHYKRKASKTGGGIFYYYCNYNYNKFKIPKKTKPPGRHDDSGNDDMGKNDIKK